jgi:hypothetical protein
MNMNNAFENLGDFQPKPKQANSPQAPAIVPSTRQLEAVAEQEGFALNNHAIQRKLLKPGRQASKDRAQPMSLRIRVSDWNRFSTFCERHEYTVAEGFARLVDLADTL